MFGYVRRCLWRRGVIRNLQPCRDLADVWSCGRSVGCGDDAQDAFAKALLVSDEFSYLASNAITWRVEALKLGDGKLHVARQIPETKNYNGDMERIPDIGRAELLLTAETRVWKGGKQVKPDELTVGDALLINLTGEQAGKSAHCTDIWVGAETHKSVSEGQGKQRKAEKK